MTKKKKYLFTLIIAVVIIAILLLIKSVFGTKEDSKEEIKLAGAIIFTKGTGILCKLNLQTKEIDTIFHSGTDLFGEISRISKNEFIVSGVFNGIRSYNYISKGIYTIRTGSRPIYAREHKKLFYYDKIMELRQYGLYMSSIDSLDQSHLVVKFPEGFLSFVPPVQISSDEIVFIGVDTSLWKYNISSGILAPTGISGIYYPKQWISNRNVLLCSQPKSGFVNIYEIDLKTKNIENRTSTYKNAISFVYIDKYDVVVYCSMIYGLFGELSSTNYDLNVYSFKEQKNYKLVSDMSMYSAVYLDE